MQKGNSYPRVTFFVDIIYLLLYNNTIDEGHPPFVIEKGEKYGS